MIQKPLPKLPLLFTLAAIFFLSCEKSDLTESESDPFEGIYRDYGIKVHYRYSPDFFPKGWQDTPVSAFGTQISPSGALYMVDQIGEFLSRYDKELLTQHLTDIYLFETLSLYGKEYGGTYRYSTLYIPNNGYSHGLNNNRIRELLHSEFSSILYHSNSSRFPAEDWQNLLPENFSYTGTGIERLGEKGLLAQTEELLEDGFLLNYSTSSMENDFNQLVSWMFIRHAELKELVKKYPLIKAKYDIVRGFYKEIDSGAQFPN